MDGKQKNLGVCEKTLQGNFTLNFAPYDNFLSALGSSVVPPLPHPPPPPPHPNNVVTKKALISTQFAQDSILFGEGGEGSLGLLISLETRSLNSFDSIAA